MKKILFLLGLSITLFTSCEGDQGPPGPEGPQGVPGEVAAVYEIENVVFNAANQFAIGFTFPEPIFTDDNVLVFRLEGVTDDNRDIWEPLPTATVFLNDANDTNVLYRFNFTDRDVDILLESNNPDLVPADLAQNQVFRVVVVPGAFAQNNQVNSSNLKSLFSELNIDPNNITKVRM